MKKFFMIMTVCNRTPSEKGIYTALFILILTATVSAQIEMKDNTTPIVPFYKWDVSFDLKPLFRSAEPFNLLVKRYTSPNKAWRLGMDFNISRSPNAKDYIDNYVPDSSVRFGSIKISYLLNAHLSVGRQFEKRIDKVVIYTSTDLAFNFDYIKDKEGWVSVSTLVTNAGQYPINKLFVDTIVFYKSIGFSLSQSLGFKYNLSKQLSFSFEANGVINVIKLRDTLDSHGVQTISSGRTLSGDLPFTSNYYHWLYRFKLNPIAHIYLSYHF